MSNAPVVSITDELVAELECAASNACQYAETDWFCASDLSAWLSDDDALFVAWVSPFVVKSLLRERAEMQQQLRAAMISVDNCELFRKDAERYQWLRESAWYAGPDSFFCGEGGEMNDYKNHNYRADTLDAAIDAAMQEQKQ